MGNHNPSDDYAREFARRRKTRNGLQDGDASLCLRTLPLIRTREAQRPTYHISASCEDGAAIVYKAFDGDLTSSWSGASATCPSLINQWIQIEFTGVQEIYAYGFITSSIRCPVNWHLKVGLNATESSWVVADERVSEPCTQSERIYTIGDPDDWMYYSWEFSPS